jgi:hypothetical protein
MKQITAIARYVLRFFVKPAAPQRAPLGWGLVQTATQRRYYSGSHF